MKRKHQSRIAEAIHEAAKGLHRIGAIDKTAMCEFDVRCLAVVEDRLGRTPEAGTDDQSN